MKKKLTFIDLFSGSGGMTLGFERSGFSNIFSIDNERSYCQTYRENFPTHKLIEKNIEDLTEIEITRILGGRDVDVIIGGPPCQGFSMAGNIGRKFVDDPRNHLFREFARVVSIVKPKIFVMENVARLYTHNRGKTREDILKVFKDLGYEVECKVLHAQDYGVPQKRQRVFFIGNRLGIKNTFPTPTVEEYITVEQAINDLPILQSGEKSTISNHEAMVHSLQMLEKMEYVTEGGSKLQIPEDLRPLGGDSRKYIRYERNKPSFCITGDMRKVFHYNQNRALTVRELARLQSYPDTFVFLGNKISQQQQVGNSVPPLLADAVAKEIRRMLKEDE